MTAINITAYTEDASQIEAIKAVIKAFKIKYSITKSIKKESPYNPEFAAKILKGDKDFKEGKGISMTMEELENLCK